MRKSAMFEDRAAFAKTFTVRLREHTGKDPSEATHQDCYRVLASMVKELMLSEHNESSGQEQAKVAKCVHYLSMEFLPGRMLRFNLTNLGVHETCKLGLQDLSLSLSEIELAEPEPALGSGGLGRLAACFLGSLSAVGIPAYVHTLRYTEGYFHQEIRDGGQIESPDRWLQDGNEWERQRPEVAVEVKLGGSVLTEQIGGRLTFYQENYDSVKAVPYDMPVPGYMNDTTGFLRTWDLDSQSAIATSLYPDDAHVEGKMLRLKQEYCLVSAAIQSIVNEVEASGHPLDKLPEVVSMHINDTHPALAVPELMRVLMDDKGFGWDEAWSITVAATSYTNHTVMSEALEVWPVDIIRPLPPRIYMLIDEINERFCRELWSRFPGEWDQISRMAIVAYGRVRMSHLAVVGSHSVNGVSRLHTRIVRRQVMRDLYEYYPERFTSKTNGVDHRRWLLCANPALAQLISETAGTGWITDPLQLSSISPYTRDSLFLDRLMQVKRSNKAGLARIIKDKCGINVDVDSIFDVHVKRIHAYKRQILNILHIIHLYNRLQRDPGAGIMPRTFIFSGKAAPGYFEAKLIIRLIHSLASVVNYNKAIGDRIKVVFIPDYSVSLAERVLRAADVSEQISMTGKEASGTGNIKSILNGALIIGTPDGCTVEIRDEVGVENIFIFGPSEAEVQALYRRGYSPRSMYASNIYLKAALDQLLGGWLPSQPGEYSYLFNLLVNNDHYLVLRDFPEYVEAQTQVDRAYRDSSRWSEMCAQCIANSGRFSSDVSVRAYAKEIWGI